jgi:hypothetical protein
MRGSGILAGQRVIASHQNLIEDDDERYDRQYAEKIYQEIRYDVAKSLEILESYKKSPNVPLSRKGFADISYHLLRVDYPTAEVEPSLMLRFLRSLKELSTHLNWGVQFRQFSTIAHFLGLAIARYEARLKNQFVEAVDYLLFLYSFAGKDDDIYQMMLEKYPELKLKLAIADPHIIFRYVPTEAESLFSQTLDGLITQQTLLDSDTETLLSTWFDCFHKQPHGIEKLAAACALAREQISRRYGDDSKELFCFQTLRLKFAKTSTRGDDRFLNESKLQLFDVMWKQAQSAGQSAQPVINELVNLAVSYLAKGK